MKERETQHFTAVVKYLVCLILIVDEYFFSNIVNGNCDHRRNGETEKVIEPVAADVCLRSSNVPSSNIPRVEDTGREIHGHPEDGGFSLIVS